MGEPKWPEGGGEFGGEGNPSEGKAPRHGAADEFGGEGNPAGLRPSDAEQEGDEPGDGPRLAPRT